ncbi:Alg9-like mannosyltransferase family-domain-containing protein [Rhodofomes roseus]|uniref:Mannosyltransferase n=1 Tax=Rhodofomes roseus TaxID=34475 RepID=A0ABQ8KVV7_9APHY|nr:Alg9-like mannosyltransferase family-domain-containing protein [Rhodofomes roseus]KAH9843180.1 Alg9-like mannosyltransferase family-domain-containing protein [Rhodofomes roseus]
MSWSLADEVDHMQISTAIALAVRVSVALLTRTFFQPDEYFQSLEVAHHLVFGYGNLTWEWLTAQPIRSIIYPALNVPVYWALGLGGLDATKLLIWAPKVLHGILAAGTDVYVDELARKIIGPQYAPTVLFLSLTSFFHVLSLSRSLSNSLETTLTTVALSHYPWDTTTPPKRQDIRRFLATAALACAVRPTNAVIWVYMSGLLLWRLRRQPRHLASLLLNVAVVGLLVTLAVFLLDSAYYGSPTCTPLNFLRTNLSSVSLFYGISQWHYYFSQAIPILCTSALPFVLHGAWLAMWSPNPALKVLLGLIGWTIGVYSLAGHKEWRFIHPLLPLMHILAAKSLVDVTPRSSGRPAAVSIRKSHRALLLTTLPLAVYVVLFHSQSQIEVVHYLGDLPSEELHSVGFLMPCHSTPWQAYLHRPDLASPGRLWALGCEPPITGQNLTSYRDQTDIFYESPANYLRTRFPGSVDPAFPASPMPSTPPGATLPDHGDWKHEWPEYLVMFGALLHDGEVQSTLESKRYREVWKMESGWEGDRRRQGGVRVWRFQP